MALSDDKPRSYTHVGPENAISMQASSTGYVGSAASVDSSGDVGPLDTSDSSFVGFFRKQADNSSGSAGDTKGAIITEGEVELVVTGVDNKNDINSKVYATDDDTFTLTASGATAIGRVSQIVSTSDNKARVRFQGEMQLDHT